MTSGIYAIWRSGAEECYIGSSQNIEVRWYRHRRDLRKGNHPSDHLQNAWNKYGESAFTLSVIELCQPDRLIGREQYFIDTLRPVFNKAIYAGAPMRGRRHSDEWKEKARARMHGNKHAAGQKHSVEWRAANSARNLGRKHVGGWHHTVEAKARIAAGDER